jgi:hypothetical protein
MLGEGTASGASELRRPLMKKNPELGIPFVSVVDDSGHIRLVADANTTILTPHQARLLAGKLLARADRMRP